MRVATTAQRINIPVAEQAKVTSKRLAELREVDPKDLDQHLGAVQNLSLSRGQAVPGSMSRMNR